MSPLLRRFCILLIGLSISPTWGFTLTPAQKQASDRAIGMIVNCDFAPALSVIDSLIAADPSSAFGYLLKMCALGLRDLDYDKVADSASFVKTYAQLTAALNSDSVAQRDASYLLTMRGFGHATYASFCLRLKNYGPGVQVGLDALKQLKEAKQLDPSNTDVDFFLGLYECARADLKKRLWWILFWYGGSRQRGTQMLETCARTAQFARHGAPLVLADVYAQDGKYERSRGIIDSLLALYPSSRFMLWSRARYHESQKDYLRAAADYRTMGDAYEKFPQAARSAALTRRMQASMLVATERSGEARAVCAEIVRRYGSRDESYFRDVVREAHKLIERIDKHGES